MTKPVHVTLVDKDGRPLIRGTAHYREVRRRAVAVAASVLRRDFERKYAAGEFRVIASEGGIEQLVHSSLVSPSEPVTARERRTK